MDKFGRQSEGYVPRKGKSCPRYMDYHDDLKLPKSAIDQIAEAHAEAPPTNSVCARSMYYNEDGNVYCLLDAPDQEASPQTPRGSERALWRGTSRRTVSVRQSAAQGDAPGARRPDEALETTTGTAITAPVG